jgi:nitrate reductase NapE
MSLERTPSVGGVGQRQSGRRREVAVFLLLAFGIWPVMAVAAVGGYGFVIWMWQLVFGPPGPPA